MSSKDFAKYGIIVPEGRTGNIKTACPECQFLRERHPKDKPLSVNIDDGIWKCHHCGWSGAIKAFKLIEKKNRSYKKPNTKMVPLPQSAIDWFESRMINQNVLRRNKIFWGKFWFPQVDGQREAVHFPYFENGDLVNIKARTINGERLFSQSPKAKPIPYGLDDIKGEETIIITEGEIDKLSLEVAGFRNVVSTPIGAINPNDVNVDGKLRFLEFIEKEITIARKIVIVVDADDPGKRLQVELARRCGLKKVWRVVYPRDCKDANDVLCKHGADELKRCVDDAEAWPIDGLVRFVDVVEDIIDIYTNGFRRSVDVGIRSMTNYYNAREGELTAITGIPSHGKSTFLKYMAVHLARVHGWRFGVFSPEHFPPARYFASLAQTLVCKPFTKGVTERMSAEELRAAIDFINESFHPIIPDVGKNQINTVLEYAKILVLRYGIKGLIVDPWNRFEHQRPHGMSEADYVAASLTKFQNFSREYDLHTWIVAHPKLLQQKKDGTYFKPTLYSISGGANWRNCIDHGIIVWRDLNSNDNVTEIHVQKIKYPEIGKLGIVKVAFDKVTERYYDLPSKFNEDRRTERETDTNGRFVVQGKPSELPF